jgi:hypothetical protein
VTDEPDGRAAARNGQRSRALQELKTIVATAKAILGMLNGA